MNGRVGWQPIATAPKDGTKILLRKDGETFIGWYDDKHDPKYAWWFVDSTELEEKPEQPFGYSETFVKVNAWGKGHGPEEWMGMEDSARLVERQSAALKLAKDALESCDVGDCSTSYVVMPSFDAVAIDEALAAINEVLGE